MKKNLFLKPILVFTVCLTSLIPHLQVFAQSREHILRRVQISIGQPSIWSLAQAHYFIQHMHERNRDLKSKFPSEEELNPNRINSNQFEVFRSFLGIEAQYDQGMGVQNRLNLEKYRSDLSRKESAQNRLDEKTQERDQVEARIKTLKKRTAALEAEQGELEEIPEAKRTEEQNQRIAKIKETVAKLKKQQKDSEEEKASLDEEISTLTTQAGATATVPTLTSPTLTQTGQLPTSEAYNKFIDKTLTNFDKPNISAQISLDNFIHMQYEIISKQLTLLRDEVGPDYRVVFLELPASIYTVDEKANDYVAQVEWKIDAYYRALPNERSKEGLRMSSFTSSIQRDAKQEETKEAKKSYPITLKAILEDGTKPGESEKGEWVKGGITKDEQNNIKPISLEKLGVRTLDIIPRQSALNVNQNHAVIKQTAILAALKFVIGFAGKVDYQRQRELYDQYIRQAIFASGYGKGNDTFGWTYGPMPGSRRLAPGVRTTYAVLAIPREALALRLSAVGRAYEKDENPRSQPIITGLPLEFNMLVPTEDTQSFWVEGAAYTPVKAGEPSTIILQGRNFSPQLGVMVNGVPLKRVISIARNQSDEPKDQNTGTETKGEYEIVNSGTLILNFSMKSDYIGTPIITLVTPEKTGDINSFDLKLNYHDDELISLKEAAGKMPMFIEGFRFEQINEAPPDRNTGQPRISLIGQGFRPNPKIYVDGRLIPNRDVMQESTSEYIIPKPPSDNFKVRISQSTKQSIETLALEFKSKPAGQPEIASYTPKPKNRAMVEFMLTFPGQSRVTVRLGHKEGNIICPRTGRLEESCDLDADAGNKFRFEVEVDDEQILSSSGKPQSVLRDKISLTVSSPGGQDKSFPITLPLTPSVTKVEASSGHFGFEQDVVIHGVNLQNVAQVYFGTRKAEMLFQPERNSITVRVPRGAEVPPGEKVRVPIRLETDVEIKGRKVSNAADLSSASAYYIYTGDPLPQPNAKRTEQSDNH
jgi:hypothetical protein